MDEEDKMIMERKKLWCSPHQPLTEQGEDFIMLKHINPDLFQKIINTPEDIDEMRGLAYDLSTYAHEMGYNIYQPAGNPAFQFILGQLLATHFENVSVFYAYSERVSMDEIQPDGTVKKVSVFKHKCWIKVK